jgi:hypothetical protein
VWGQQAELYLLRGRICTCCSVELYLLREQSCTFIAQRGAVLVAQLYLYLLCIVILCTFASRSTTWCILEYTYEQEIQLYLCLKVSILVL